MSSIRHALRTVLFAIISSASLVACAGNERDDSWVGRTYLLDVPNTGWSQPTPRIGSEIGDFVPQFVVNVTGGARSRLDVTMGTAVDGVQDLCTPTVAVPASADYPGVQIGPTEFVLHIQHLTADVRVNAHAHALALTDVLPNGETRSRDGVLRATLDMRELYPLFTLLPSPTPETVCAALESFSAPCEACPTDGAAYCLTIEATDLGAQETDMTLLRVDADGLDASCL